MKNLLLILSILVFTNCGAQTNFKPFTKNASFAYANESVVKELLDTTANQFLAIANNSKSILHKSIQNEFEEAKQTDRLESYIYPKKLHRNNISVQFIDWTNVHGLYGNDSAWSSEMLTAIVLIPIMVEEQNGSSINNLCFITELERSSLDRLESATAKQKLSFQIKKIKNLSFLEGEVMYK